MNVHIYTTKAIKALHLRLASWYWTAHTLAVCWLNGIKCGRGLKALGRARINVSLGGKATIVADESVTIGNNVMIGGGVQIFDTNFHSTDSAIRASGHETRNDVKKAPVVIGNHVFIGTNSIICKGVTLGDHAIVAAGSVVVKSIPPSGVWGGNPASSVQ